MHKVLTTFSLKGLVIIKLLLVGIVLRSDYEIRSLYFKLFFSTHLIEVDYLNVTQRILWSLLSQLQIWLKTLHGVLILVDRLILLNSHPFICLGQITSILDFWRSKSVSEGTTLDFCIFDRWLFSFISSNGFLGGADLTIAPQLVWIHNLMASHLGRFAIVWRHKDLLSLISFMLKGFILCVIGLYSVV